MNLSDRIKQQVELNFDELVATRRHIHSHPELSFEEFETTKFIAKLEDILTFKVKIHIPKLLL
jgi:amidohydrolase